MKVSKVILIVVALHVLVIGGIFVFEGCSRTKVEAPALAENESLPGQLPAESLTPTPPAEMAGLTPAVPPPAAAVPPALPPAPAVPETPAPVTYSVKPGDSLWKIAKNQNTTLAELMKANNLTKSSVLKVGQKLTIPAKAAAAAEVASAPAVTAVSAGGDTGAAYTVVAGDSLWKIANKNGTTVAALKQANNLTSDSLKVGQKLTLPGKSTGVAAAAPAPATASAGIVPWSPSATYREPGTYTENNQTIHVVDMNESPAIIARRYGVRVDELMKANGITNPGQIHYGQTLIIPVAPAVQPAANRTTSAAPIVSATNVN